MVAPKEQSDSMATRFHQKVDLYVNDPELELIDKAVAESRQSRNQFVTAAAIERAKAVLYTKGVQE